MRNGGLVILFLCLSCGLGVAPARTLAEQERVELKWRQVPKEVRRNVRLAYPYHIYRDWAKLDTLYSVRVISANYETVYFDSTGEWLRAYRPVRPSELPYRTYLFLKEEFGVYRVMRAYQVQQSDDLAYYSVEMEHKRIPTLKTYLEFDFVGDLTMLDGTPVGGSEEAEETEALSREAFLALYADVYDPEAEEAAYAEEAERKAAAALAAQAQAESEAEAEAEAEAETLAEAEVPAETVAEVEMPTPVADTLPLVAVVEPEPEPVAEPVPAPESEPEAVAEVVLPEPEPIADTPLVLAEALTPEPIDTTAVLADTMPVMAEVVPEPEAVAAAEPEPMPEPVAESVPAPDTNTLAALPDTAAAMADTTPAPLYPDIVGKNFKKRFPNVEKVEWRMEDSLYLVTFTQFGKAMAAAFRQDGVQLYTAYAFNRKEMPLPIDRSLQVSA
ncbi:MAG: hypothetical protein K2G46_05340, partial [Bacteroidales bacterium]|nr:hypothetical protein [Bacteroidales bacterium]